MDDDAHDAETALEIDPLKFDAHEAVPNKLAVTPVGAICCPEISATT